MSPVGAADGTHRTGPRDKAPAPGIPRRFARLCDDAAIFPPGSLPLADAIAAHLRHRAAPYADLVGPLVLSAVSLADVAGRGNLGDGSSAIVAALDVGSLAVSVTIPAPESLGTTFALVRAVPALRLVSLEVALPAGLPAAEAVRRIDAARAAALHHGVDAGGPGGASDPAVQFYVEVPRDDRRAALLAALVGTTHRAKFRTGGVTADLHPDEAELADAIARAATLRVPFKSTAGLHHAIRNTDPQTGFEQHGFLNLLLASAAAARGESAGALERVLADRDAERIARSIAGLSEEAAESARALVVSFGTCSVTEPLNELIELGLIAAAAAPDDP